MQAEGEWVGTRLSIQICRSNSRARGYHVPYEGTVSSQSTERFKLRVKRLPVGADAGVSEAAVLRVYFGHIFCKPKPLENIWSSQIAHAERTAGLSFHCSAISAN
jgi:hypothetical protein